MDVRKRKPYSVIVSPQERRPKKGIGESPGKPTLRRLALTSVVFLSLLLIGSCREPTHVLIETYTDVPYQSGRTVAYFAGKPGTTEYRRNADAVLDRPWTTSAIGTLTVVPEGEDDEVVVTVKIVMGIGRATSECAAPLYDGCIVARRRIRYVPHERLKLPIALYANCTGVACAPDTTCNILGNCVSATPTCGSGDTCVIEGESPPPPGGGSPIDGNPRPDLTTDAGDGAPGADSASNSDAALDSSDDASENFNSVGAIYCPGAPNDQCKANVSHCCLDVAQQTGGCAPGDVCPSGGTMRMVFCDGSEDCPQQTYCCEQGLEVRCLPVCPPTSILCHGDGLCPLGHGCVPGAVYRRCFPQ